MFGYFWARMAQVALQKIAAGSTDPFYTANCSYERQAFKQLLSAYLWKSGMVVIFSAFCTFSLRPLASPPAVLNCPFPLLWKSARQNPKSTPVQTSIATGSNDPGSPVSGENGPEGPFSLDPVISWQGCCVRMIAVICMNRLYLPFKSFRSMFWR